MARAPTRRTFVSRLGGLIAGAGALPLLPASRAIGAEDNAGVIPPNWYCVRRDGVPGQRGWTDEQDPVRIAASTHPNPGDVVEVCMAGATRDVSPSRFSRAFYNRARGIVGIELGYRRESARYAPTQMIANNLSFDRARERFLAEHGISRSDFDSDGRLREFQARQYLVDAGGDTFELVRGSTVVPASPPAWEDRPAALAGGIGKWMLANLKADGGATLQILAEPRRGVAGRQRHPPFPRHDRARATGRSPRQCGDPRGRAAQSALQPESVFPTAR